MRIEASTPTPVPDWRTDTWSTYTRGDVVKIAGTQGDWNVHYFDTRAGVSVTVWGRGRWRTFPVGQITRKVKQNVQASRG